MPSVIAAVLFKLAMSHCVKWHATTNTILMKLNLVWTLVVKHQITINTTFTALKRAAVKFGQIISFGVLQNKENCTDSEQANYDQITANSLG